MSGVDALAGAVGEKRSRSISSDDRGTADEGAELDGAENMERSKVFISVVAGVDARSARASFNDAGLVGGGWLDVNVGR
jgi:hypothetical protein